MTPVEEHESIETVQGFPEARKNTEKAALEQKSAGISQEVRDVLNQTYTVETYSSDEISPELTREISDIFRLTFNNAFPEYLICTDCEIQMPASQIFGTNPEDEVDLKTLDSLDPPPCEECGQPLQFFHGLVKTEQKIAEKFRQDAQLTVLRNEQGTIQGFTFSYKRRLGDVFKNEWGNKFGYMDTIPDKGYRDLNAFLAATSNALGEEQTPDTQVYCWNCVVTRPGVRSKGYLPVLMGRHAQSIPQQFTKNLTIFGETIKGTKFHQVLQKTDLKEVDGYLNEGYVLTVGDLKTLVKVFSLPKEQFQKRKI